MNEKEETLFNYWQKYLFTMYHALDIFFDIGDTAVSRGNRVVFSTDSPSA